METITHPKRGCGHMKPGAVYLRADLSTFGTLPAFVTITPPIPHQEPHFRGIQYINGLAIDLTPPTAEITSPEEGEGFWGLLHVAGTANHAHPAYYRLEHGLGDDPVAWTEITTSTTSVIDGMLGTWDTDTTKWDGRVRDPGRYLSICKAPGGLLKPSHYHLSVGLVLDRKTLADYHEHVLRFEVSQIGYLLNPNRLGIITPLLEWDVKRIDETC